MCCETGVCGPSVDEQLIAVREDLRWAEAQVLGAALFRHVDAVVRRDRWG